MTTCVSVPVGVRIGVTVVVGLTGVSVIVAVAVPVAVTVPVEMTGVFVGVMLGVSVVGPGVVGVCVVGIGVNGVGVGVGRMMGNTNCRKTNTHSKSSSRMRRNKSSTRNTGDAFLQRWLMVLIEPPPGN
jgi:hypothetical protein